MASSTYVPSNPLSQTTTNTLPAILIKIATDPLVDQYDLSGIVQFHTGAAPLPPKIIAKLVQKYPHAGIKQGRGMTESTSCITSTPPEYLHPRFAHTVGKPVSNTLMKLINLQTGLEAGVGEVGEVSIRSKGAREPCTI
jgi:4-coumarate--CoA ligase